MTDGVVMVTGATGFIGKALVNLLVRRKRHVRAVTRNSVVRTCLDSVAVGDIGPTTSWGRALEGANCIVHLAGRAHVVHERSASSMAEFRRVNVDGTLNLARQAVKAGVKRFIYISSVGVNGNITLPPFTFRADDSPNPATPYATSKLEAERGLLSMIGQRGLEIVIIRPPLVYGPGAPGNFGRLVTWVLRGVPLPLGAIGNRRSLIAVDNLVDFIDTCIDHANAANQTFLVSDGEDLSTTELLRRMAMALERPSRLVPVPQSILQAVLKIIGQEHVALSLCGSLQVDTSKARDLLGWLPPVTVDEALRTTALAWLVANS